MPKITKVYTGAGDDGSTSLGSGQRVRKNALRIEAYGAVDELNSQIGVALAIGLHGDLSENLRTLQNQLFHLGADLCIPEQDKRRQPGPRIEERHVRALEDLLNRLTRELEPLENFILPGGAPGAAQLHVARTVCRRAERSVVALADEEAIGDWVLPFLNRLSDGLFVMARYENLKRGVRDILWNSRA
jgi:cob(I)alamin adenosyltransferase